MVEHNIVDLLETIGLQRGVDLFIANLPAAIGEGVVVKTVSEVSDWNSLDAALLTIVVAYNDNTEAITTARAVRDVLKANVGTLGTSSATALPITLTGYGTDELSRQVYAVTAQVVY